MNTPQKLFTICIVFMSLTACRVETYPDDFVLNVYFAPPQEEYWEWAAATSTLFDFYNLYYSQADIFDYQYDYFGYTSASIDDIGWILWHLGGIDSYSTGTLNFSDIKQNINRGNPILLHYGSYYSGHVIVLHGYDSRGYVYLHEPSYGTRIIHFDDLYYQYFHGHGHYWESSLILEN